MTTWKGIIKNNEVVLEQGAQLPEGAEVEVRVTERPERREELFARVLSNRIHRYVGIDELIEQDKKEREERMDQWLQ